MGKWPFALRFTSPHYYVGTGNKIVSLDVGRRWQPCNLIILHNANYEMGR